MKFKYTSKEHLYKVLKAIDGGMNESWEYRERFGNNTSTLAKLKELGYLILGKKKMYIVTEAGKKWLANANIKTR